jgi:hypothetical protein
MGLVANKMKVRLPADTAVDAEIDLCKSGDVYFLRARLNVSLPGLEREVAQAIVDAGCYPTAQSDLDMFDAQFGIPAPPSIRSGPARTTLRLTTIG